MNVLSPRLALSPSSTHRADWSQPVPTKAGGHWGPSPEPVDSISTVVPNTQRALAHCPGPGPPHQLQPLPVSLNTAQPPALTLNLQPLIPCPIKKV